LARFFALVTNSEFIFILPATKFTLLTARVRQNNGAELNGIEMKNAFSYFAYFSVPSPFKRYSIESPLLCGYKTRKNGERKRNIYRTYKA